jgi:hypothetical protein
VLNGALLTHPVIESAGQFIENGAYDPAVSALADVDAASFAPRRRLRRA